MPPSSLLVLLSPSKTQDFASPSLLSAHSHPSLLDASAVLMKQLRALSAQKIATLMGVSAKIAQLNHQRFQHFSLPFTPENAKQAVFAFQGDVYDGLDASTLDEAAMTFAQQHMRILSGLYGALKPLDLIQPYRLEMKTALATPPHKNLYQFWGSQITEYLNHDLAGLPAPIVVNLASEEYYKAVKPALLSASAITPQFKEKKGAGYQMIGLFAKRARGLMARFIIQNRLTAAEALLDFSAEGYRFAPALSQAAAPVFVRG